MKKEIKILSEREHIQERIGMWIGGNSDPTQLFLEIFGNSIDEVQSGYASEININIFDNGFSIEDNGRGIPFYYDEDHQEYIPILIATKLFSSGKFNKDTYKTSIGMNGVGMTVSNYLSERFTIDSYRDSKHFHVSFNDGIPNVPTIKETNDKKSKTIISCFPSKKYFDSLEVDKNKILSTIDLSLFFIENLKISLNNVIIDSNNFQILKSVSNKSMRVEASDGTNKASIVFGYKEDSTKKIMNGSINLLRVDSGTHISGLLEKSIKISFSEIIKEIDKELSLYLEDDDYICGLEGFILLYSSNPEFSSQTKERFVGKIEKEYNNLQLNLIKEIKKELLKEENKQYLESLIKKFKDYRSSLNKLSSNKYITEFITLNKNESLIDRNAIKDSKLIDCTNNKRDETELIICEGDSAGGGLIPFRDHKIHAILPLRGKVLNVIDKDLKTILNNVEVRSLINSLGVGCLSKEDSSKIRYDKILIATDADVDGMNIQALLIGLFCYLTPNVVYDGRIHLVDPCLFGQYDSKNNFIPIWNKDEKMNNSTLYRFKGLGSFDAGDLSKVVLDKNRRKIYKLSIKNKEEMEEVIKIIGDSSYRIEMLKEKNIIVL